MEDSEGAGGAASLQKRGEMETESPVLKQCREEQNRKEAARETFSSTPEKTPSDTDQELLLKAP